MDFWSRCSAAAMIRRALRKAVSPLVIGAATTPNTARIPPNTPSQPTQTYSTTLRAAKNYMRLFPPLEWTWDMNSLTVFASIELATSRHPPS